MINVSRDFGVYPCRDERNRGIWVGNNKIGSVGIRVRHGVSFHGLSLNVNLSLEPFRWIQPCGLVGVGVSSLARETGRETPIQSARERMHYHLSQLLN